MEGHMILYRGSLKSCNYHCSYCPFSKHRISSRELEKDQAQWQDFVRILEKRAKALGIRALMVTPYGEALIHPWYFDGFARISRMDEIDAVGAQTNLSFPVKEAVAAFGEKGGVFEKLRIWATFHPEMTEVSQFADSCRQLKEAGISFCVGAVGVPENLDLLRRMRRALPEDTYLWINRMDGLRRPYTPEEKRDFEEIDPYFFRELLPVPANCAICEGRLLVEGNGSIHTCNISPVMEERWEESLDAIPKPVCSKSRCTCYLAYGGRAELINQMLFGPYPLFRIPRRPKAVFLDIAGTLLPEEDDKEIIKKGRENVLGGKAAKQIDEGVKKGLEALYKDNIYLFFATTLPFETAIKRCREIRHLFQGGIFAGGAHLLWDGPREKKECFYFLDKELISVLGNIKRKYGFRILTYKCREQIYKITLLRPLGRPWKKWEAKEILDLLPTSSGKLLRYYIEERCLQVTAAKADKAEGVKLFCQWLGISPREIFAVGDSGEDVKMMKLIR